MGKTDTDGKLRQKGASFHARYVSAGEGNASQQLVIASAWVEAEPAVAQAWYLLGEAQRTLGDRKAALSAFQKADSLRPDDPATVGRMAELLLDLHDYAQSRQQYKRVLALIPEPPFWAFVGLGNACERLGAHGQALSAFLQAADLNRDNRQLGRRILDSFEKLGVAEKKKHAERILPHLQALADGAGPQESLRYNYSIDIVRSLLGETVQQRRPYLFHLDGFVSGDEIGGWYTDMSDPDRVHTVQLIEAGTVIGEARSDLAFAFGRTGGFRLRVPDGVLDGAIHEFLINIKEDDRDVERFRCVTPKRGDTAPARTSFGDAEWTRDLPVRRISTGPVGAPVPDETIRLVQKELSDAASRPAAERCGLLLRLAGLLEQNHRMVEAMDLYREALALDDEDPAALASYVHALTAAGREQEGEEFIARELERLPEEPVLLDLHNRAMARRRAKRAEMIAFYLPQFHLTPENNAWWGRGFTEWTNVGTARPLFDGHVQPRRPTALGYYDLRVPEAVNAQFDLARRYGIAAFCYYYYWFDGRKVLDRPLQDLLDGRTGPFPFCICWANEDWTRSWDGQSGEVLLAQNHSPQSDRRFMEDIIPVIAHADYYRYHGKPLVMVYRADKLSAGAETVAEWRNICRQAGIGEIYLCAAQSFGLDDPRDYGCDAAVEFPPHAAWSKHRRLNFYSELPNPPNLVARFGGRIYDYRAFADAAKMRPAEPYTVHRSCMMAWDNTPRRGQTAHVYHNFNIGKYREWLVAIAGRAAIETDPGLVFINAWNEWAEGTTLEPDNIYGFENLEATLQARRLIAYAANPTYWLKGEPQFPSNRLERDNRIILVGHDAIYNGAQINLLNMARCLKRDLGVEVAIYLFEGGPLLAEYERLGPTIVLGREEGWKQTFLASLWQHWATGVRHAICNTVVTGEAIGVLREAGMTTVSLVHEMPSLIRSYGLEPACWKVADLADRIVFASAIVAEQFCARYWPHSDKIMIAPQGIARNGYVSRRAEIRAEIRKELDLPENAALIIGCGYGDTRKGIDLFVQMAGEVAKMDFEQQVAFIWVGKLEPALESYVRADIRRLQLDHDLIITGLVTDPARYFIAGDVFALTSREDPFPSVVMEAFEAFMPVVAFDGGGGYVEIVSEETGGLVPYLDVAAMAERIRVLLSDDALRERIGKYSHAFSRERFGYVPYMRKLLALLDGGTPKNVARGELDFRGWPAGQPPPRISVIVPNYNYGRYLELRLRTIIDQTLQPVEIIVLDDASTDYSMKIIEDMARSTDIPIRILRNETNTGNPFVQWVRGLDMASGDLVWIAEADDYCEPILLERLAREMIDETVVMSLADSIMVDDAGGSGDEYKIYHGKLHGVEWNNSFKITGQRFHQRALLYNNVVPNASAVLFRKSAVPADTSLIEQYRFSGDWWFWIELSERGRVAYVSDTLNYHRRHDLSVMGEVLSHGKKLLPETMSFFQRLIKHKPERITPEVALKIIDRLNEIYGYFPELTGVAGRLADNADLGPQYRDLRRQLDVDRARAKLLRKTPATLLLSGDALQEPAAAALLVDTLRLRHRVSLVLVGDESAAKAAGLAIADAYQDVVWIIPAVGHRALRKDPRTLPRLGQYQAQRLTDGEISFLVERLLESEQPERFYTAGLRALSIMAGVEVPEHTAWEVIAGPEFDALLGNLPPPPCTSVQLRETIGRCNALRYLGDHVPHAAGRMAQAAFVLIELLEPHRRPGPENIRRPRSGTRPARLVAIAAALQREELHSLAQALKPAKGEARSIVLRLLAWGNLASELRREFAGNPSVEVVHLYDMDMNFSALGDAAIDWGAGDLYGSDRTWVHFVQAGMKVIMRSAGDDAANLEDQAVTMVKSVDQVGPLLQRMFSGS